MGYRVSDGKAPAFTFPASQVINDYDLYRVNGWTFCAIGSVDATQTDRTRAGDMDTNAVFSVLLPTALTPAVGDLLYWSSGTGFKRGDTDLVAAGTVGGVGPVVKVLVAKNAAHYAQVRILQAHSKSAATEGGIVEQALIAALVDNSGGAAVDGTIAVATDTAQHAADGIK